MHLPEEGDAIFSGAAFVQSATRFLLSLLLSTGPHIENRVYGSRESRACTYTHTHARTRAIFPRRSLTLAKWSSCVCPPNRRATDENNPRRMLHLSFSRVPRKSAPSRDPYILDTNPPSITVTRNVKNGRYPFSGNARSRISSIILADRSASIAPCPHNIYAIEILIVPAIIISRPGYRCRGN